MHVYMCLCVFVKGKSGLDVLSVRWAWNAQLAGETFFRVQQSRKRRVRNQSRRS